MKTRMFILTIGATFALAAPTAYAAGAKTAVHCTVGSQRIHGAQLTLRACASKSSRAGITLRTAGRGNGGDATLPAVTGSPSFVASTPLTFADCVYYDWRLGEQNQASCDQAGDGSAVTAATPTSDIQTTQPVSAATDALSTSTAPALTIVGADVQTCPHP